MWRVQTANDLAAFEHLVKRWEQPIKRLCAQVVGDSHLAEDLCQETFIRAFANRSKYRPKARFSTWIWRIALNLCYSRLRRRQCKLDRLGVSAQGEQSAISEPVSEQPSPDQSLLAREEADLVKNALAGLPPSMRTILILRYCEGMKMCEVAKRLGIPDSTAASRCGAALSWMSRIIRRKLAPGEL